MTTEQSLSAEEGNEMWLKATGTPSKWTLWWECFCQTKLKNWKIAISCSKFQLHWECGVVQGQQQSCAPMIFDYWLNCVWLSGPTSWRKLDSLNSHQLFVLRTAVHSAPKTATVFNRRTHIRNITKSWSVFLLFSFLKLVYSVDKIIFL